MSNTFTPTRSFCFGGANGQDRITYEGTLVIDTTAYGGAVAGDLPASMFGLRRISNVSNVVANDNSKVIPAAPAKDGSSLMIGGGASNAAADLANGTYVLTIQGVK